MSGEVVFERPIQRIDVTRFDLGAIFGVSMRSQLMQWVGFAESCEGMHVRHPLSDQITQLRVFLPVGVQEPVRISRATPQAANVHDARIRQRRRLGGTGDVKVISDYHGCRKSEVS